MYIEELSVGDWVWCGSNYGQVAEIFTLKDELVIMVNNRRNKYFEEINPFEVTTGENDVRPIPLTKEILEKNGFIEIVEDIYKCCVGEVYIEIGIYEPMFFNIGARVITPDEVYDTDISSTTKANGGDLFVHDLQHALRLCGIDKKIKL